MDDSCVRLVAWIDGELEPNEAALVELHLEGCRECQSKLAAYRQASVTFAAACDRAASATVGVPAPDIPRAVYAAGLAAAVALVLLLLSEHGLPRIAPTQEQLRRTVNTTSGPIEDLQSDGDESPANSVIGDSAGRNVRYREQAQRPANRRLEATAPLMASQAERVPPDSYVLQPGIEITIPPDALFPPGAVPDGVSFVAHVTLGPDGSAERMSFQPRVVEFEGRANRP
jgi:hypothetical protein